MVNTVTIQQNLFTWKWWNGSAVMQLHVISIFVVVQMNFFLQSEKWETSQCIDYIHRETIDWNTSECKRTFISYIVANWRPKCFDNNIFLPLHFSATSARCKWLVMLFCQVAFPVRLKKTQPQHVLTAQQQVGSQQQQQQCWRWEGDSDIRCCRRLRRQGGRRCWVGDAVVFAATSGAATIDDRSSCKQRFVSAQPQAHRRRGVWSARQWQTIPRCA